MNHSDKIFVYGTLQIPEVMATVTGREFAGEAAWLEGYARYRVRRRSYPGLRPEARARTEGILYYGLDRLAWARLDAFEDSFYRRETLRLGVSGGRIVRADVYVVRPERYRILLPLPWSLERFRKESLAGFMPRCFGLRA